MKPGAARARLAPWIAFAFVAKSAAASAGYILLDLPLPHPAIEASRRVQAREGELTSRLAWPQGSSAVVATLVGKGASPYDREILAKWLPGTRRESFEWEDSTGSRSLRLSPILESGFRGRGGDTSGLSGLGGLGLTAYGRVSPAVSFYTRGMVYTEKTDRAQFEHQFGPDQGETYTVEKGAGDSLLPDRTFSRFEHYLLLDLGWLELKAGRDRVRTGPGYFTSLMASGDTPPYYLLEGRVAFASWLHLDNYLLRMTDTDHDIRKYANLHRFEVRPHRSLSLAFQDIVIYQDRDPDPAYLLPFAPLTFIEANNGGRDNAAMGFDATWASPWNLTLWGELFLDDLLGPTSFFDDFWENRWAALAGFQAVAPAGALDADLVVEYAHVEPWTYNGRKPQTSFRHFNVPSAGRLGPDSRSLDVKAAYRPWKGLEWSEWLEISEKGTGPGSILGTIHDDALHGLTKVFLKDSERRFALTHAVELGLGRHARLGLSWRHAWGAEAEQSFAVTCLLVP